MFRFKLAPGQRGKSASGSAARPIHPRNALLLCGVGLGVVLVLGWAVGRLFPHAKSLEEIDTGPILLSIQKIGQLHTAKSEMKDVLHQDSEREPEGWLSQVPGAETVTHWATHNQALVVAEGTVEAGVDLSQITPEDVTKIRMPNGKTRVRVRLPEVTLYPPNVRVRVESAKSGPFWRDENIVPRAQQTASRRFLETAEKSDLKAMGQCNAIQTLQGMQRAFGYDNIEFYFAHPIPLASRAP